MEYFIIISILPNYNKTALVYYIHNYCNIETCKNAEKMYLHWSTSCFFSSGTKKKKQS